MLYVIYWATHKYYNRLHSDRTTIVSVGGWTNIRLCRSLTPITFLHCPNECFVPIWAAIYPAVWPPMMDMWCCAHGCASSARINAIPRSPTPITSAHCSNACLYQFGSRSAQPFGRLCWMCNVARTFARAAHTSMRTRDRRLP
jgi:hypothetical protein